MHVRVPRDPSRRPDELRVGWCTPDDAALVLSITREAFAPQAALDPPSGAVSETLEAVRADLLDGRGVLAWWKDEPVGACRVARRSDPDRYHVRRLAVVPQMHRRGVASAIMRWLEEEARSEGVGEIRLGVRNALPSNFAFYDSLGYERCADHGIWTELRKPLGWPSDRSAARPEGAAQAPILGRPAPERAQRRAPS